MDEDPLWARPVAVLERGEPQEAPVRACQTGFGRARDLDDCRFTAVGAGRAPVNVHLAGSVIPAHHRSRTAGRILDEARGNRLVEPGMQRAGGQRRVVGERVVGDVYHDRTVRVNTVERNAGGPFAVEAIAKRARGDVGGRSAAAGEYHSSAARWVRVVVVEVHEQRCLAALVTDDLARGRTRDSTAWSVIGAAVGRAL